MYNRWLLLVILLLTLGIAPAGAAAQEGAAAEKEAVAADEEATRSSQRAKPIAKEQAIPEMVVETERLVEKQDQITIKAEGLPAEVNIITKEDIKMMPYTGDAIQMLRKVPGIDVQVFPRGDMGVQLGMRGFIGNNVTAVLVDGMPLNTLNWYHGLLNVGWLIPEMIERIEIIKGPFSAVYGNFARAGVINFVTKKSDPSPSLGGFGGSFDTFRGVGVISDPSWSKSLANVTPFLVWEGYSRGGYRHNEDFQRGQFFNKFTVPLWQGNLSLRGHYASRTWGDAGYLSIAQMKAGIVNRRDARNLTDRGDSEMADFVLNYEPKGGEAGFHASLYYCYMWNATGRTFYTSPQARIDSSGSYYGWKLMYDYRPFDNLSIVFGNDLRNDVGRKNAWQTVNYYTITKPTQSWDFTQFNTGFFVQAQYKPFSFLKVIGGGRYDIFNTGVDNNLYRQNSGSGSTDFWSPKIGLVITPYKDINIFANRGTGFASPDYAQVSPASATQKPNFNLGVSQLETWDVGFNALLFKRLYISFGYYNTLNQKEQMFNNTTQTYDNLGASKRTGYEVEAKIFLTKELTLYGSWAHVRGRLKNPATPGAYYISGLPPDQSVLGLEFQKPWAKGEQQVGLSAYWLRVGRKPINTKGTLIGSQLDRYFGKIFYRYKKWTFSLDATLTPRKYAGEYYYNPSGSEIQIIPLPTWDVLAGVRYQF
ncbi:MAG: TonB-dependent receptor [Thermodesulfobacteriota bacterium]